MEDQYVSTLKDQVDQYYSRAIALKNLSEAVQRNWVDDNGLSVFNKRNV